MSALPSAAGFTSRELLEKAQVHYDALRPYFTGDLPFQYWPCGCVLNSMIDFLWLATQAGVVPAADARTFLNAAANDYLQNQRQGDWYDDWCWWGIATAKAFAPRYRALFDVDLTLIQNFSLICTQTYRFMQSGTPPYSPINDGADFTGTRNAYDHVVEMAKTNPAWEQLRKDVEPMWNVGCWQGPMTPSGEFDPRSNTLGSFQDSVMNGLAYVFVQRTLGQTGSDGLPLGTAADVDAMATFYRNWMGPEVDAGDRIYNAVADDRGLFRERIGRYRNGTPLPAYHPDLAWGGDQGLMLSALAQRYHGQTGTEQAETLSLIHCVVRGVMTTGLGAVADRQRVILPWCSVGAAPADQPGSAPGYGKTAGGDNGDYFSGTGIFMRGLLEALDLPEVRDIVSSNADVLSSTIAAMEDGEAYARQCGVSTKISTEAMIFDHFNQMASYLVASRIA